MGTEIPSFQTLIHEAYLPEEVEVIALNENADRNWLEFYAPDIAFYKSIPITFPMLFDEFNGQIGGTFAAYDAIPASLPSMFLIDQTGMVQLRYNGIDNLENFNEALEIITTTIDTLLANSPNGL